MQNLPDWIQAICAFSTLILAFIIYFQNKKIKTLTDVVHSLNQQVIISQELLNFEIKSKLNLVQPNFVAGKLFKNPNNSITLNLINNGTRAKNIKIIIVSNIKNLIKLDDRDISIQTNNKLQINIEVIDNLEKYEFKLIFEDENTNLFEQTIVVIDNKPNINISKASNIFFTENYFIV